MENQELTLSYFFENLEEDFLIPEVFEGIQHPWEALRKSREFLNATLVQDEVRELNGTIGEHCTFKGFVAVGAGTVIGPNVSIEGPVIIGENVTIGHGALIRPGTIISDNCVIGHGCEIKNSLVFKGAKVQSMTFVGDSVIGRSARVGSGTITANRRFDQGEVGLRHGGQHHLFGTEFFGCILGDQSRLGANVVTLPGTVIGPYTWVTPLTQVSGFVERAKIVQSQQNLLVRDNRVRKLKP